MKTKHSLIHETLMTVKKTLPVYNISYQQYHLDDHECDEHASRDTADWRAPACRPRCQTLNGCPEITLRKMHIMFIAMQNDP